MLHTLAVANYRSLHEVVIPLGQLNVITGANGSGKSNLYRALALLGETAAGGAAHSLAREGGLESVLWAGPERISRSMRTGEHAVQGGPRKKRVNLRLGFGNDEFGYAIDYGLPIPHQSMFVRDPEIKRECIWHGQEFSEKWLLVDRRGSNVRVRDEDANWRTIAGSLSTTDSMFTEIADAELAPEVVAIRDAIRSWRFYDHFRTDAEAPARRIHVGTRTMALAHDGSDLAAAWQTIVEMGDARALEETIEDAFPGSSVSVSSDRGLFGLQLDQPGLLRPLTLAEVSDGTLRYLLLVAALLTPRPPELMVLNEPETSLHPELIPALARLILRVAESTQVWVVSHSGTLTAALEDESEGGIVVLEKEFGETRIANQGLLNVPTWSWPGR